MKDDGDSACEDQRERFWADYHTAYETLRGDPSAWAEFQDELELWDSNLADGLELAEDRPDQIQDLT